MFHILLIPIHLCPSSLAAAVPRHGALIFGAPRRDEAGKVYNSMFAIDDEGAVQATFDKFHLVPFGEYVPFRGILPLEKLTAGRGDFTPGFGPQTLAIRELPPFAALICYEVIFSGQIVNSEVRPEWILNITNDAWFGPFIWPQATPGTQLSCVQLKKVCLLFELRIQVSQRLLIPMAGLLTV